MNSIYGTMSIVGGTMSSIYGTLRINVGTMSSGHEVVETWTKFIKNEHFRVGTMKNIYGTMDNFDGAMNNAGGTMYIQNHM